MNFGMNPMEAAIKRSRSAKSAFLTLQPALRLDGGHATGAGGGHRLAARAAVDQPALSRGRPDEDGVALADIEERTLKALYDSEKFFYDDGVAGRNVPFGKNEPIIKVNIEFSTK